MQWESSVHRGTRRGPGALALGVWVLLLPASLAADDLNPPGYRGGICSTSASWSFSSPQPLSDIQPDGEVPLVIGDFAPILNAAFGGTFPSASAFGGCGFTVAGGISGGTDGCEIAFNIPNCIDNEPVKYLRIQVTYAGPKPSVFSMLGFLGVPGDSSGVVEEFVIEEEDTSLTLPRTCKYFYQDWRFLPNPDWEQVALAIPAGTILKQVIIDTISTRTRRFPICDFTPSQILSSQPTTITIQAEFDGIASILSVQALFELISAPAPRQPIDITALLVPFVTEVTDTSGTIVIPGVAFPPGTQASVTFSILTEGDTPAGFFAIDELTIDIPQ